MSIEDSNPERRNLVVLSSAIIIYYLAGGSVKEKTLSLEIINIEFSNTAMLSVIVWFMLGWFSFRYFIENRYVITNELKVACNGKSYLLGLFGVYFVSKFSKPEMVDLRSGKLIYFCKKPEVNSLHDSSLPFQVSYQNSNLTGSVLTNVKITGLIKWPLYFLLSLRLFFSDPNVTRNILPLYLPLIASVFGLCNEITAVHPLFESLCSIFHL